LSISKRAADAPRWLFWSSRVVVRSTRDLVSLLRGGHLAEAIEPWMRVDRIDDVPFDKIAADGARAVLFDLENTLIPPGGPFDEDGRTIVAKAKAAGLSVGVVSNASGAWVVPAVEAEGLACVAPAAKPSREGFVEACRRLGVRPDEAVYVGDQVITDVLGSQRAGMRAVLVLPKYTKEFRSAKFQRIIAKLVIRLAGRRGDARGIPPQDESKGTTT
jgi:HAD superfamily phosphatase (TIGR01668 family)